MKEKQIVDRIIHTIEYVESTLGLEENELLIGGSVVFPREIRPWDKIHDVDIIILKNRPNSTAIKETLKLIEVPYSIMNEKDKKNILHGTFPADYLLPVTLFFNQEWDFYAQKPMILEGNYSTRIIRTAPLQTIIEAKFDILKKGPNPKHSEDIDNLREYLKNQPFKVNFYDNKSIDALLNPLFELSKKSYAKWGKDFQVRMVIEEYSELIESYTKTNSSTIETIEENVDALIVTEQLITVIGEGIPNHAFEQGKNYYAYAVANSANTIAAVSKLMKMISQYFRNRLLKSDMYDQILEVKRILITNLAIALAADVGFIQAVFDYKVEKLKNHIEKSKY